MLNHGAASQNSIQVTVAAASGRDCGPITDYFVRDSSHNKLNSIYSGASGNVIITITDLKAGTQYAVRVSATNDQSGEGPLSEPVTFTTIQSENLSIL